MKYRIHPGIICQRICGRYFLISLRDAWQDCPRILELNDYGAFCWRYLERGLQPEDIIPEILKEYGIDKKTAREGLAAFTGQLKERHYLIPVQRDENRRTEENRA